MGVALPRPGFAAIDTTQLLLFGLGAVAVLWLAKKAKEAAVEGAKELGGAVNESAGQLVDAVLGPPECPDCGPPVTLTETAQQRMDRYIALGYAYRDSNGVFRFTPEGEAYIAAQGG